MKLVPVFTASLMLGLCSCSSNSTGTDQDPGVVSDDIDVETVAPNSNPDGVPYPTDNLGTLSRKGSGADAVPGSRIANYKFLGYPDAKVSEGLQPISLAQYFDPTGGRYRIIHIQASGVWCSVCRAETTVVTPLKAELDTKKTVWLVSLAEGPTPGTPSKQKDLDGWIAEFKSPYTHWLDPGNQKLGPFYDRSALPWNANIDARTMEILTAGTGGVASKEALISEIDNAIRLADTQLDKPLPPVDQAQ